MKQDLTEKNASLSIDVEQWRRDIQTFAETTSEALSAIIAELSSSCSRGEPREDSLIVKPIQPAENRERHQMQTSSPEPETEFAFDACSDDRLAKLKSQLAKRLGKTA